MNLEITPDGQNWGSAGTLAVPNTLNGMALLTFTGKALQARFKQTTSCAGEKVTATIVE